MYGHFNKVNLVLYPKHCKSALILGNLDLIVCAYKEIWTFQPISSVTAPKARVHHWQELLLLVTKLHITLYKEIWTFQPISNVTLVTAPKARVHHWQELLLLVTKLQQRQ